MACQFRDFSRRSFARADHPHNCHAQELPSEEKPRKRVMILVLHFCFSPHLHIFSPWLSLLLLLTLRGCTSWLIKVTQLYIGYTTDIRTRVWEHKTKVNPTSFTARYNVNKLIYYKGFEEIQQAKDAEGKKRDWKEALINRFNPEWKELWDDFL
jgi:putative endonuclease